MTRYCGDWMYFKPQHYQSQQSSSNRQLHVIKAREIKLQKKQQMDIDSSFLHGGQQSQEDISHEWVEDHPELAQLQYPINVLQFPHRSLSRNPQLEFKIIEFMTQTKEHVNKLYKNPIQFSYNRYNTILPYEYSMVKLNPTASGDKADEYINANFITTPYRDLRIIATQGPLSSTLSHFWRMVHESKVSSIFMLCNLEQRNVLKCYKYWPSKQESPIKILDRLELHCIKQESIQEQLVRRVIKIVDTLENTQREITHYHWKDWKDNEAPVSQSIPTLQNLLAIARTQLSEKQQILVHCSAGVGRTGSFIALLNITTALIHLHTKWINKQIEEQEMGISLFGTVRRLREQRWGMVFKKVQYEFIYEYTRNFISKWFNVQHPCL